MLHLPSLAVLPTAHTWPIPRAADVSPAAVALGASYFQRLLAASPELASQALAHGFFSLQQQPGAATGCQVGRRHHGAHSSQLCPGSGA
jgi:hypothetical protein